MNENSDKTKECFVCHLIKKLNEFYNSKNNKDGKYHECKKCTHKKQKVRNKNLERKCKICHAIKTIEEFGRHANSSRRFVCYECYDKITPIQQKQRDFETKERHKQSDFLSKKRHYNRKSIMCRAAKENAKKKKVPFAIIKEDIIIPEYCPILNIRLKKGEGKRCDNSPSLDRIIPEKGYVKGNVAIISWRANSIKNCGSALEHMKISKYIIENSVMEDYCI